MDTGNESPRDKQPAQQQQREQEQQEQQDLHHQNDQQQQQVDWRLLEGLPPPALRRVLQLASTPYSPALCRVCCVSKGFRAAAEAAAPPICLTVSLTSICCCRRFYPNVDAATALYRQVLASWVPRYAHCMEALTVEHQYIQNGLPRDDLPDLLLAAACSTSAAGHAAAGAKEAACGAAGDGAAREAPPGGSATPQTCSLQRLNLRKVYVSPRLVKALVSFDRLQVLTLADVEEPGVLALQQVAPQFRQLQKLGLKRPFGDRTSVPVGALLRALPRSLRAVDLQLCASPCSTSNFAHLVQLTSLRLEHIDLEEEPLAEGHQRQQQQQQQQPGALKVLSLRPTSARSWFAVPSLEAVELTDVSATDVRLAPLAACPLLRQLRVQYPDDIPSAMGVSALTQLTKLSLEAHRVGQAHSSSTSRELAALKQLQVLEASDCIMEATDLRSWLPLMGQLSMLVVLAWPMTACYWDKWHRLAEVIGEWHRGSNGASSLAVSAITLDHSSSSNSSSSRSNSSSSNSSNSSTTATSSSSSSSTSTSGTGGLGLLTVPCTLQRLQMMRPSRDVGPGNSARYLWLGKAADVLTKALPWLEVTRVQRDSYPCPCWTMESELVVLE